MAEIIDKIKTIFTTKNIINFLYRYAILFTIIGVSLYFINPKSPEIRTIFLVTFAEALALWLSNIAIIVVTKVDFAEQFDEEGERRDYLGNHIIYATVILATHLLVGISILSTYIVQYN